MRHLVACLLAALLGAGAVADATVTARSSSGGAYAPPAATDGDPDTWWASGRYQLPQWLRVDFYEVREVNRVRISQPDLPLYARWRDVALVLGNGLKACMELPDRLEHDMVFPPQRVAWLELRINRTHSVRPYVGCAELVVELDETAPEGGVEFVRDPDVGIAQSAVVTTDSERTGGKYGPARINDGDLGTNFATLEGEDFLPTIRLELPRPAALYSASLYGIGHTSATFPSFVIECLQRIDCSLHRSNDYGTRTKAQAQRAGPRAVRARTE
ncbi:MAG: discoidin domain-containing protein [Armatimonadota bacterium]|nr:discoidin domain-containing protein [Armatimonadota bacterium]